jgi:hypothetical protein
LIKCQNQPDPILYKQIKQENVNNCYDLLNLTDFACLIFLFGLIGTNVYVMPLLTNLSAVYFILETIGLNY